MSRLQLLEGWYICSVSHGMRTIHRLRTTFNPIIRATLCGQSWHQDLVLKADADDERYCNRCRKSTWGIPKEVTP